MTDYRDLAEELGVEVERGRLVGGNLYARCPLHEGDHLNFALHVTEGVWYCHRGCGGGNIVTLVRALRGVSWAEAVSEVVRYEQGHVRSVGHEELVEALSAREPDEAEDPPRAVRAGRLTRERWPSWWPVRGFDAADWHGWDCMLDLDTGDVSIPVYHDRMLVGEIRRRMPGAEPKYLYSEGFRKSSVLFGEQRLGPGPAPLYVVEGPLDAIWLQHVGLAAVALLGSRASVQQVLLLAGRPDIVVALDSDPAGRLGGYELVSALQVVSNRVRGLVWPAKDPQELTPEEVLEATGRAREPVAYAVELGAI